MALELDPIAARRAELARRLAGLTPEKRAELAQSARVASEHSAGESAAAAFTIRRRAPGTPVPMSFAQELLWRLELANPGHGYNVPRTARLQGELDLAALQRALDALVRRHEALRTTFTSIDGEPRQIVHDDVPVPLALVDLSEVADATREEEAQRRVRELTRRPFDLERDLQLRATVVRIAPDDHVLLLESHHVVADTVSRNILLRELGALYTEYRGGESAALPPLGAQYADFALWEREHLAGARLERLLAYWRSQLGGVPPLELPTDRPRSAAPSAEGGWSTAMLPADLLDALRALSQANGVTLFMTLLAGFNVLLARYAGQDDVVVGSPIAGRTHAEMDGVIGLFLNTLVLRTSLAGDPTFAELLGRVRATTLGAYEHQEVPYEKLAMELHGESRSASDPLFNVLFALQDPERLGMRLQGTTFVPFSAERGATKFDLFLTAAETPGGLRLGIAYRTDLFDARTTEAMLVHLRTLLEAAVATPNERLSRLRLIGAAERELLVREWNATALPYPQDESLVDPVRAQAARAPDAIAIECEGRSLTYGTLDAAADRLAAYLAARGVSRETVVALYVERSIDMVVAMLAIHRAGGAYLPLDPAYPRDRLVFMLEDSGANVLITEDALRAGLANEAATVISLDRERAAIDATEPLVVAPHVAPDDLAYLIYTSGSTGKPKGVSVTHRNVVNFLAGFAHDVPLGADDRLVAVTPLSFDIAGLEIFLPLTTGACVIVASRDTATNPAALAGLLTHRRATHMQATPATWRMLLDAGWAGHASLVALCGGEALAPSLARAIVSRTAQLWNLYGPTEATIWATMHRVTLDEATAADDAGVGAMSIGRPMRNVQVYVLDPAGEPTPVGVPGELLIGGVGIARGYLHRPDLTAQRFVPDTLGRVEGARLYRTGDRARWRADGRIEFLGRFDQQVKLRGHRIELGEIEHALGTLAGVGEAAVLVREDTPGDARLVAYLVSDEHAAHLADDAVVDRWAAVWDDAYERLDDSAPIESGFNISGWKNSYDGEPIPADEMREWVDRSVDRMLATKPQRVLDIGCGTGLFTFRLAPRCAEYTGVDSAAGALRAIEADPAFTALGNVTLRQLPAHELATRFAPGSFDLVILNSVVQYFPSVEYLVDVLTQAAALLAPGGTLFVGDVRALPLLDTFHTSIALSQAPDDLALDALAERVRERMAQERELVIDPAFFVTLQTRIPALHDCLLMPKRGFAANELTKFRYDALLRAGETDVGDASTIPGHAAADVASVQAMLAARPDTLRIVDVADRRVERDIRAGTLLTEALERAAHDADAPAATVVDLRAAIQRSDADGQSAAIDLESLFTIDADYDVESLWPASGRDGHADVLFRRRSHTSRRLPAAGPAPADRAWGSFVHQPVGDSFEPAQIAAWRAALAQALPEYMVPNVFVRLATLPLTPNGKLDRNALPSPTSDGRGASAEYVVARGETEARLVEIWEEVLQHAPIGVHDDFFALGGHSLLALRVLARVHERFGVRLPLRVLFERRTIEALAEALAGKVAERDAIVAIDAHDAPLSSGQEVLWLVEQATTEASAYHMPDLWRVTGALDVAALQRALDRLVERHAALRTTFTLRDGVPTQTITAPRAVVIEQLALDRFHPREREDAARQALRRRVRRPFDLASDPLLRAVVARLGEGDHMLLLVTHHIVSDGWSRGIMLRELSALYDAERRGETMPLPALPLRYIDYATWQRHRLAGAEGERQLAYWTERLADSTFTLDLPTDRARNGARSFVGARHAAIFSPALLERLQRFAQANDATPLHGAARGVPIAAPSLYGAGRHRRRDRRRRPLARGARRGRGILRQHARAQRDVRRRSHIRHPSRTSARGVSRRERERRHPVRVGDPRTRVALRRQHRADVSRHVRAAERDDGEHAPR